MKLLSSSPVLVVLFFLFHTGRSFSFIGNRISDLEGDGDDFINQTLSWKVPKDNVIQTQSHSICGTMYLLGGPEIKQNYGSFSKNYTDLPPHDHIYFSLYVSLIDKWSFNNTLQINFDQRPIVGSFMLDSSKHFTKNICGADDIKDLEKIIIYGRAKHTGSSLNLSLQISASKDLSSRSFGFRELVLVFRNSTTKQEIVNNQICGLSSIHLPQLECPCTEGNFRSFDSSCQKCNPLCATCFGPTASNCFTCADQAFFNGKGCTQCHPSCATCFGSSANECLTCVAGHYMTENSSCINKCNPPLVQSTVRKILYCSFPCSAEEFLYPNQTCGKICNFTYNSISWGDKKICSYYCPLHQYYIPPSNNVAGSCMPICPPGFYTDNIARYCFTCQDKLCISCPTDYGKKCVECKFGAILDSDGVCKAFHSFKAIYMKALDKGHRYYIEISPKTCNLDRGTLQQELTGTFLSTQDSPIFSFDVISKTENRYIVDIILKDSVLDETRFNLTLDYVNETLTLPKLVVPTIGVQEVAHFTSSAKLIFAISVVVGFGGAIALDSKAVVWSIISFQQFVGCLIYINTDLPLQVNMFFSLLELSRWGFLPNPFDYITKSFAENALENSAFEQEKLPPQKFVDNDISISFIKNAGGILFFTLVLWAFVFLVKVLTRVESFKEIRILKLIKKHLEWNIIIRVYLETGIPLMLSVLLQFKTFNFSHIYLAICSILSIFCCLYMLAFLIILVLFLHKKTLIDLKKNPSFQIYKTLWEGIELKESLNKYYHVIILLRGFLVAFLVVFGQEIPYLQILPLIMYNAALVYHLFRELTFEDRYLTMVIRIKESLILIGEMFILGYLLKGGTEEHYNDLGWLIASCFFSALCIEILYMFGKQIFSIKFINNKTLALWKYMRGLAKAGVAQKQTEKAKQNSLEKSRIKVRV